VSIEKSDLELHKEAWEAFQRQVYEVVKPHEYRFKKGRKLEYLNPWKNLQERVDAEKKSNEFWVVWLRIFQKIVQETGKRPTLTTLYEAQETPEGM
jgi:hypothetical protein